MMEKAKTAALIALVALSLLQSYLLAYSMPGLGATVRSEQDYVNTEPLGTSSSVEGVIFPEDLVLHMGDDRHTVLHPGTQFYDMILKQRIVGREFKGLQRSVANLMDWEEIRKNELGIELRFGNGLPVDLLQKLLKLEGDLLFLNERIERIWIFKLSDSEEVRTFFFSSDGESVYEAVRADLTVRDVQDYAGFGEHLPLYRITEDGLYLPEEPLQATELVYPYEMYSPEQMQRSLFFDSSTTKAIVDRSGSEIFTDGKRGLKVEQNGMWINYTNSSAGQNHDIVFSENVYASVDFVNLHGGWDGSNRLISSTPSEEKKYVGFRKYIEEYPVIDTSPFRYGYMRLTLHQGVVTEYSRSLLTLKTRWESRDSRWLIGGEALEKRLDAYNKRDEVVALFPALRAVPMDENRLQFVPVWAVRLKDGTEEILQEAYPPGFEPPVSSQGGGTAEGADGEAGAEGQGDGAGGESEDGAEDASANNAGTSGANTVNAGGTAGTVISDNGAGAGGPAGNAASANSDASRGDSAADLVSEAFAGDGSAAEGSPGAERPGIGNGSESGSDQASGGNHGRDDDSTDDEDSRNTGSDDV